MAEKDSSPTPVLKVTLEFDGMTWGALRGLVRLADQTHVPDDMAVVYATNHDEYSGHTDVEGLDLYIPAREFLPGEAA